MKSPEELQAGLAATLGALSHTQGALLRLMSNVRDMQLGNRPDIDFAEVIDEWEKASKALVEAAGYVFEGDLPEAINAVALDER